MTWRVVVGRTTRLFEGSVRIVRPGLAAARKGAAILRDGVARLRDSLVTKPAFHRLVTTIPLARPIATGETRALFDVVSGFVYAQTLAAMVELKVFPMLAAGPVPEAELARRLTLPARSVDVLMTTGAALGLVERRRAGWGLGLKGAALLGQGGIVEMIAHHDRFYADLSDPVALLRSERATALSTFWTYAGEGPGGPMAKGSEGSPDAPVDDAPPHVPPVEDAGGYTELMAASQAFIGQAVLHNPCFRKARRLVDLGGGAGAFAIAALKRQPKLTAIIADRADVVPHASEALRAAGLEARAQAVACDFFRDPLPLAAEGGGAAASDATLVTLVRILHDHDDDAVLALLTRVRGALHGAHLAIVEPMADPRRPSGLDVYFPWYFMAMGQGRLRTPEALRALLAEAGFATVTRLQSRNPTLVKGLIAAVDPD